MASLLLRLEGSAAGYSFFGRLLKRSKNYVHGNNLGGHGYHRMISTINSKVSPRLMLPPAFEGGNPVYQFYNLADDRVESLNRKTRSKEEEDEERDGEIVSCSHGWVAFSSSHNRSLFLSNPLTGRHIKLPPFHPLRDPDDGKHYFNVSKIILSCSPDDDQEKCRAMMSFGFGDVVNRLAFCWPGCSTHWTCFGKFEEDEDEYYDDEDEKDKSKRAAYDDTIYSARHKLLFSITKSIVLQVWDLQQDPPGNKLTHPLDWSMRLKCGDELQEILQRPGVKPQVNRQKYLVLDNHSNQLFLVRRHIMSRVGHDGTFATPFYFGYRRGDDNSYPHKTIGFDVHKIDWDTKCGKPKVTYMEGGDGGLLDGLAMFIGLNHSFALPAAEYPGLIPNSIYFTDKISNCDTPSESAEWGDDEPCHPRWVDRIYGGHDIGIFNYENKTFSPCYYPCDVRSMKRITPSPFWFTSTPHKEARFVCSCFDVCGWNFLF